MTPNRKLRRTLLAAAAFALLATLAFLFAMSNPAAYKSESQALALLRELRDFDQRWDGDALRLANALTPVVPAVPDRRPVLVRILHELEQSPASEVLAGDLDALRAGMEEKLSAYAELHARHVRSLRTAADFRERLAALANDAARAGTSSASARADALLAQIERARLATNVTDIEAHTLMAQMLEPPVGSFATGAVGVHPGLRAAGRAAQQAGEEFISAREAEASAWSRFSMLTIGARVDVVARRVGEVIDAGQDEKERWRVYLAAYAAALVVGIGYLLARLAAAQGALRSANGELDKRVQARTRDLTRTLEQLKESEAQLVQSEKMSSLGQLVAGVAHEVNTPLAYVKNSLATVRDRMPEVRETLEQAERMVSATRMEPVDPRALHDAMDGLATRLFHLSQNQVMPDIEALTSDGLHGIAQITDLVANLRNFARLDRSRVATFDVNEGIRTTLLIARPALRHVHVEVRLGELPRITCSPSQVNQVVLNLLTNAAQAIEGEGGLIRITTRHDAGGVAIEVADNGKGIPAAALPRVFDPFFTTKEVGKGTGLGLSIAYKIITQHGGRIEVESREGAGATFRVVLPLRPPQLGAPVPALEEVA
jgi:two-component system, NtrC family, sensor kinase